MNYSNENITQRAEESPLWKDLEKQQGKTLPYLLERYLLLENWSNRNSGDEINFLNLLMADVVTVLLNQEERIRRLENKPSTEGEL